MARPITNPFGASVLEELLEAFPPGGVQDPVRAGRPRLLTGPARLGQDLVARRWAEAPPEGRGVVVPAGTATTLVDLSGRWGGTTSPELREADETRQAEHLTRALRDLGRAGCERLAVLGLTRCRFSDGLLGVLDKTVLQVTVGVTPEVESQAPPHWERMEFRPLERDVLAMWVRARFKQAALPMKSGVADLLVDRAAGVSEDVLTLCAEVYRTGAGRKRVKAVHVQRALDRLAARSAPVLARVWETLSPLQQNLLRALAAGEGQLFAATTRERFGLRSTASVARTLELLGEKRLVVRSADGGYDFENPWSRRWVEREALPDVGILPPSN